MDTALPAEYIVSFGALYLFFRVLLFCLFVFRGHLPETSYFAWPNKYSSHLSLDRLGCVSRANDCIYFLPLGKGAGEQRRGLMPFLYSIRAFSDIKKYQRKKKGGDPLLGLAKSICYPFWDSIFLIKLTPSVENCAKIENTFNENILVFEARLSLKSRKKASGNF